MANKLLSYLKTGGKMLLVGMVTSVIMFVVIAIAGLIFGVQVMLGKDWFGQGNGVLFTLIIAMLLSILTNGYIAHKFWNWK